MHCRGTFHNRFPRGGLAPYAGAVDQPSLLAELLYNKRYSLMYEGGHSWIDYRRYGLTANLQSIDRVGPASGRDFPDTPNSDG
jgi:hypothetical protein